MNTQVLIGCDPELFIVDENKEIVSASKIIKNEIPTKGNGSIVNDGMQIELHPAPHTCREVVIHNIRKLLIETKETIKSKKLAISNYSTIEVKKELLESLPAAVTELGCEPDKSAYTGKVKILKIDGNKHYKRYCGGHIHYGLINNSSNAAYIIDKQLHKRADEIIRKMDYFVGNTSIMLDHSLNNYERRKIYGQAGSYRLQPHGIEYRVLSNFWMKSPGLASLMFLLGRLVLYTTCPIRDYNHNKEITLSDLEKIVPEKDIENAINNNDFVLAERNFRLIFNHVMNNDFFNSYFGSEKKRYLNFILFANAYHEYINFLNQDIPKNWDLEKNTYFNGWQKSVDYFFACCKRELLEKFLLFNL